MSPEPQQAANPGQPSVNEPLAEEQSIIKEIAGGIKNALEKGSTLDKAKKSFLNGGYDSKDVEAAVNFLTNTPGQMPPQQAQIAQPQVQQQGQVPQQVQQPQIQVQQPQVQNPQQQQGYKPQIQSPELNPLQQPPPQQPQAQNQVQQLPIAQPQVQQQGQIQQQPQIGQEVTDQRPPMGRVAPIKKEKKSFFGKNNSVVNHSTHKAKKSAMQKNSQLPLMGQKQKEVPKWLIILLIVFGILLIGAAGFLGVYWTKLVGPF